MLDMGAQVECRLLRTKWGGWLVGFTNKIHTLRG